MGILDDMVVLFLVFWGTSILFSAPTYSPTNSVGGFFSLYTCSSMSYLLRLNHGICIAHCQLSCGLTFTESCTFLPCVSCLITCICSSAVCLIRLVLLGRVSAQKVFFLSAQKVFSTKTLVLPHLCWMLWAGHFEMGYFLYLFSTIGQLKSPEPRQQLF